MLQGHQVLDIEIHAVSASALHEWLDVSLDSVFSLCSGGSAKRPALHGGRRSNLMETAWVHSTVTVDRKEREREVLSLYRNLA